MLDVDLKDTDPDMAAAIAKAQATLPQFWQVCDKVLDRKLVRFTVQLATRRGADSDIVLLDEPAC